MVALKLLDSVRGDDRLRRFAREANVLAQLQHPAIVEHVAHGEWDGRGYLVMAWLEGEDLAMRLARQGLTVDESVRLLRRTPPIYFSGTVRSIRSR